MKRIEENQFLLIKCEKEIIVPKFSSVSLTQCLEERKIDYSEKKIIIVGGIKQICGLERYLNLTFLCLRSCDITKCEGFDTLKMLNTLNLECSKITKIEGLDTI